jgi:hypothetical protein
VEAGPSKGLPSVATLPSTRRVHNIYGGRGGRLDALVTKMNTAPGLILA